MQLREWIRSRRNNYGRDGVRGPDGADGEQGVDAEAAPSVTLFVKSVPAGLPNIDLNGRKGGRGQDGQDGGHGEDGARGRELLCRKPTGTRVGA
jgi:hypothetical protein